MAHRSERVFIPSALPILRWHPRLNRARIFRTRRTNLDGTLVINGVRAAYRTIQTPNGNGVIAEVQYAPGGPWESVGGARAVFADDTLARRAIQNHVAADWSKRLNTTR